MTHRPLRRCLFAAIAAAVWSSTFATPARAEASPATPAEVQRTYAPAPVLQLLKGFVPYPGRARRFPHSMEFRYLPMSALMTGTSRYDWTPVENLLSDVAGKFS